MISVVLCATVRRVRIAAVCLVACVAACGDNQSPCDYVETGDIANATIGEMTAITIGGPAQNLCGTIDNNHFDGPLSTVDTDMFRVAVEGSGEMLVQIAGDDGFDLFSDVTVRLFDTAVNPTLVGGGHYRPSKIDHGAFIAQVQPGHFDVVVAATAPGDVSIPLGYRVRITADPSAKCPQATFDGYREANDGPGNTGNDVIDIDLMKDPSFTMSAGGDQAEATGIEVVAGLAYRISGSSDATAHPGTYLDRDTFEIKTDESTTEVTIRVDWSAVADLDYYLFDPTTLTLIGAGNVTSTMAPELATFPVKPDATYWLWIGRFTDSTPGAVTFDATICGSHMFH